MGQGPKLLWCVGMDESTIPQGSPAMGNKEEPS